MCVTMRAAMPIGTAFRREGCCDLCHRGTKTFQHASQHLVLPDQHPVGRNLAGRVPVPDMPGDAHQMFGPHFREWLRRGAHRDHPAIIKAKHLTLID